VRERDGTLELARIVKETERPVRRRRARLVDAGETHRVRAQRDRHRGPRAGARAVKLALRSVSATITDCPTCAAPAGACAARRWGEGRLAFTGPFAIDPFSIAGRLDASGLALVMVRPYVEPHVNVVLTGGTFAAKGELALAVVENAPVRATWKGDVAVTDFASFDRPTSSDPRDGRRLARRTDVATEPPRVA
jgi:hypothetical protein